MLRLIFTVFVTLGLLAGATLFFGTEEDVVRVGEALEPVVDRAVGLASETAERLEEEARAAVAARGSRVGGARERPGLPPAVPEPGAVEVVLLDARRGEPFVEGPLSEESVAVSDASGPVVESSLSEQPVGVSDATGSVDGATPDPEEWAGLIRRMISLYERVGTDDQ